MALRLENPAVELLAQEVADLTGETPTEAVQTALEERKARLRILRLPKRKPGDAFRFFEREVWPLVPPDLLDKGIRQEEQDEILGYGPGGV